ncbi:MAG: response regulator [Candidatus Dormibacteraceae bacterium]
MERSEDWAGGRRPVRILLIEDDQEVAMLYCLALGRRGYEVTMAADGEEGLELAVALIPDLVLLDIRLPKLTGIQVLQFLRARPTTRNIPVVVLSNHDADELQHRGLELGAVEWLVKVQTTPVELIRWVDEWSNRGSDSSG